MTFSIEDTVKNDIIIATDLGETYFQTENDPDQMSESYEDSLWIYQNYPGCLNIIKNNSEVIGSTLILPCNEQYMDEFLKKKINENELFNKIKENITYENFDTIYLCSAFIKPEYKSIGLSSLALNSFRKSIHKLLNLNNNVKLFFYWAYSEKGEKLASIGSRLLDREILKRI